MTSRYTWTTTVCFAAGVLSAIGFDQGGHLRWLFASIALGSAVTGLIVHFRSQTVAKDQDLEPVAYAALVNDQDEFETVQHLATYHATLRDLRLASGSPPYLTMTRYSTAAAKHRWDPSDVCQVIERLSVSQSPVRYEFNIGPGGFLNIKPLSRREEEREQRRESAEIRGHYIGFDRAAAQS